MKARLISSGVLFFAASGLSNSQSPDAICYGNMPPDIAPPKQAGLYPFRKPVVRDDYFETTQPAEYVDMVSSMRARARPVATPIRTGPWTLVAEFDESRHRTTYFWESAGRQAMITRWDFVAAGGGVCAPRDALNTRISGAAANLTLARTEMRSNHALWKATWIVNGSRQFEFYVEDSFSDGRVQLSPTEVRSLAEALSRYPE